MNEGTEPSNFDTTNESSGNGGLSEVKIASKSNPKGSATSNEANDAEEDVEMGSNDESECQSNEGGDKDGNANFTEKGTGTYATAEKGEGDHKMKTRTRMTRSNNSIVTMGDDAMEVDEAYAKASSDSEETKMQRRTSKRQRTSVISNEDAVTTKKTKAKKEENKEEDDRSQWNTPTYRWIDAGVNGVHQGLEIDFGGSERRTANTNNASSTSNWTPPSPFIVRPGDIILLSSGEVPWDKNNKADYAESSSQQKNGEALPLYDDPASREPGIGALDPFVGYVERLFEDDLSQKAAGSKKKKSKGANTAASQMKVRTRWFFKKEEVKGLSGRFNIQGQETHGNAKDHICNSLTARDLILTDQSDDNDVTSILRKATVVKRKPIGNKLEVPDGAFVCRYQLKFCPASSSGGEGTVDVYPFDDETDNFDITSSDSDGMKRSTSLSNIDSTDEANSSSKEEKDTSSSDDRAQVGYPLSPRRVISEGPTVGKIHVGPNHQAVVPEQIDLERKSSRRGMVHPPSARMPTLVWDPQFNDDTLVNEFLDEACALLIEKCITTAGMKPFHDTNCVESPDLKSEAKRPRECRIDVLLIELHNCRYDAKKALKKVSEKPEKFMTLWTRSEKDQFDASYRVYRESLRAISQSMGEERSTNDVIDYLYRFKLVENFRRFSAKKREKAREMMETVENRMLNEKAKEDAKNEYEVQSDESSSEEDKSKRNGSVLSSVSSAGPVNNRIRTWFRTGGGNEDAVGATQMRRNEAASLLSMIKEKVGEDAYLILAKSLKAYYAQSGASLVEVKNTAADIMKAHPDLLRSFEAFLPKEIRSI